MRRGRTKDVHLLRRALALGDPEGGLVAIAELRRRLEALEAAHVDDALGAGWSWQRIGLALGITRQAAHSRHAKRRRDEERIAVAGRARVVLERARQEAARAAAAEIDTGHLLLGLVLEADGAAAEALAACGFVDSEVWERVDVPALDGERTRVRSAVLSEQAKVVLEEALREARHLGDDHLACDHLLLAVLREPGGRGQRVVMDLGRTPRAVERRLNRARERRAQAAVRDRRAQSPADPPATPVMPLDSPAAAEAPRLAAEPPRV